MTYSANDTGTPTSDATPRPTMVDTLPERFRSDRFVVSIAQECDRTRDDRDREATRRREAEDKLFDVLHSGVRTESERNQLAAELRGMKAKVELAWSPGIVVLLTLSGLGGLLSVIQIVAQIVGGA